MFKRLRRLSHTKKSDKKSESGGAPKKGGSVVFGTSAQEEVFGRVHSLSLDALVDGGLKRPNTADEMDTLYAEVLEELAIPQVKRASMMVNQDADKKWTLIKQHAKVKYEKAHMQRQNSNETAPYWIGILGQRGWDRRPKITVAQAREMQAVLRTSHKEFLLKFVQGGGPVAMLKVTEVLAGRSPKNPNEYALIEVLIACFKALMNNDVGMDGVLDIENSLGTIASCLELKSADKTNVDAEIITLLAVACFYSKRGRIAVLQAMEDFRLKRREALKYQTLVEWFKECGDNDFRAAVATFITTIVNSAATVKSRVIVRNNFLALDILSVIKEVMEENAHLDDESITVVSTQYDVFCEFMVADQQACIFGEEGDESAFDLSNQDKLFEYVVENVRKAGCPEKLLEMLQSLALIPAEKSLGSPMWNLFLNFAQEATKSQPGKATFSHRKSVEKRSFEVLTEMMDARIEKDEKLSQLASVDSIISKQREKIEKLERDLEERIAKADAETKAVSENAVMKTQIEAQAAEIGDLRRKVFALTTNLPAGAADAAIKAAGNVAPGAAAAAAAAAVPSVAMPALDPKYAKYAKMKKCKMPEGAIRNAMMRDKVDPEPFFKHYEMVSAGGAGGAAPAPVPMAVPALDPKYDKYAKMKKMKMPEGAIRQAMMRDKVDPEPFFKHYENLSSGGGASPPAPALPVVPPPKPALDPKYAKYEKMKKCRMPEGAIRQAIMRDGLDPEPFFAHFASPAPIQHAASAPSIPTPKKEPPKPVVPAKKEVDPGCKMRGLFWTKIQPTKLAGTLWPELSDEGVSLDVTKLKAQFAAALPKKAAKKTKKAASKGRESVKLIDPKRRQNVGIGLAKFRSKNDAIKKAILKVDETFFDLERLQGLLKIAPTPDEIALLQGYEGDKKNLSKEDAFLLVLSTIPRLKQRLTACVLKYQYHAELDACNAKIAEVSGACKEVKKSAKLKKLLEIVLAIGNFTNGKTARGAAWGYKIGSLKKLGQVRSNDGKHNMLHYIAELCQAKYKDLLEISLPHASSCLELSLTDVQAQLNQLNNGLKAVKRELDAESASGDRFNTVLGPFHRKADVTITASRSDFEKAKESYSNLCNRFGEDPVRMKPSEFFSIIIGFIRSVKRARDELVEERIRAEKAAKYAAEKMARAAARKKKKAEQGGVFEEFQKANTGDAKMIAKTLRSRYRRGSGEGANPGAMQGELAAILARRKQKS